MSDSIYTILEDTLAEVRSVFAEADVDLPARQYITVGQASEIVHDCDQLTVTFEQTYTGMPGAPDATPPPGCENPSTVVMAVELVRVIEVPKSGRQGPPKPVSAELMSESARAQMIDTYLLMQVGKRRIKNNWIGGVAEVSSGTANGALQGMVLSLALGEY